MEFMVTFLYFFPPGILKMTDQHWLYRSSTLLQIASGHISVPLASGMHFFNISQEF